MRILEYEVPRKYDGAVVSDFLQCEHGFSRRIITAIKRIDNGILRNGEHIRMIDTVYHGDTITVKLPERGTLEPNGELDVAIIYHDEDIIIFDKPVNMPVHPSFNHYNDTLGNFYSHICEGRTFRPINRLDRNTSGLCIVAKNSLAAVNLQRSSNARDGNDIPGTTIDKTYYAICHGRIDEDSGTINSPIAREGDSIIKRIVSDSGQNALTEFTVLGRAEDATLLKIKLITGRTHQIRVHFSHIGNPLFGDDLYGGSNELISEHALHCGELSFIHPISRESIQVQSRIRENMLELLDRLDIQPPALKSGRIE